MRRGVIWKESQSSASNELSGVKKASRGTFDTKSVQTFLEEAVASSLGAASANTLKVDYGLVARTRLKKKSAGTSDQNI